MKTPRELLLHRHREAEPALDKVRDDVLRTLARPSLQKAPESAVSVRFLFTLWQELFLVCRRYWLGLGVAWCVIVILSLTGGANGSGRAIAEVSSSAPVIQTLREQQQWRNELLGVAVSGKVSDTHQEPMPGPRSEAVTKFANV